MPANPALSPQFSSFNSSRRNFHKRILKKTFDFFWSTCDINNQEGSMRIKTVLICLILFCTAVLFLQGNARYSFSNYLPKITKGDNHLIIQLSNIPAGKQFYIYYRTNKGVSYQVRKMKPAEEGKAIYRLETGALYGKDLEYFIVEAGASSSETITPVFTVNNFTGLESPEVYFQETPPAAPETPAAPKDPLFFRIGASASGAGQLIDDNEPPGHPFDLNGNVRFYKNIFKEKYQFDFDSNFSYTHHPMEGEEKINLSNMAVKFKTGVHSVELGDLSISGTEFTTSYLNRRGLFYQMESKLLFLSGFFANSQQKKGFDGFGLPPSGAFLFGAVAGFNLGSIAKFRGMFLTGEDNLDSKTAVGTEPPFRKGDLFSVWGEWNVYKTNLTLKGEYSHSNFGKGGDAENISRETDSAWMASADGNLGPVTAHADYKKVGSHFNSIANLFLQNDWEGFTGNVSAMISSFSVTAGYTDTQTYLSSTVQPMLHTKNIISTLTWLIVGHIQIGAEFGLDNLDYDKSSGLMTGQEDMDTIKYSATLGYISGSNSFTLKLGKTESKNFTSNIDFSLGLNLKFGQVFTLNPTVAYQSTENFSDSTTSKIYNAYLNSELILVGNFLTLTFTGSWTHNDNAVAKSTTLSAQGNLNVSLAKLFNQKIQPTLSLRGKFDSYKYGETVTDNLSLYLQADIAF